MADQLFPTAELVACTENSRQARVQLIDLPMEMQSHDRQTFASEEPRLTSLGMFHDDAEQKWWCS